MSWKSVLTPSDLEELYVWIDKIPLSKPKKKIERDFADGVLVAEIVRHEFPDMINMHNYVPSGSISQKKVNWGILNKKVFERLGILIPENVINDVCNAKSGAIELVLFNLKSKINQGGEPRKTVPKQVKQAPKQKVLSPRQSLLSLSTIDTINEGQSFLSERTSPMDKSTFGDTAKLFSRLEYEELRQRCLIQQEEIQVLRVKMRRLEHVAQLKDVCINELTATIKDCPHMKPVATVANKANKKK
ncbi:unnamed protein product [Adineta ricciae]|uniref:Calponin-homology (CH) domain-containing protein n=1 Tax=Adineta ricciae TaxID=249248 RepID=A0A814QAQ3_ADIRI|nr:unnamed protein product [Adineta ricciae]CAF1234196.1 unnamed protein product [Adineta ricciae]